MLATPRARNQPPSQSLITSIFTDNAKIPDKEIELFFARSRSLNTGSILKSLIESCHPPKKCWLLIILECSKKENDVKVLINACIKTIDLMDKQEFDMEIWTDIIHQLICKDNEPLSCKLRRISLGNPLNPLTSAVMGMNQAPVTLSAMLLLLKTSRLVGDVSFTKEFIEKSVQLAKQSGTKFELILVKSVHCSYQCFWDTFLSNHRLTDGQICATLYKHLEHLTIREQWISQLGCFLGACLPCSTQDDDPM